MSELTSENTVAIYETRPLAVEDLDARPGNTRVVSLGGAYAAAAWAITKWVGEKVAGGIVGAAAGKLFSEVMNAIGHGRPRPGWKAGRDQQSAH